MIDWIGPLIDLYKDFSNTYETKIVPGDGRTPNEAARDEGKGWKVGFWGDHDPAEFGDRGYVRLHRRTPRGRRK
jgi:hypothetical protein